MSILTRRDRSSNSRVIYLILSNLPSLADIVDILLISLLDPKALKGMRANHSSFEKIPTKALVIDYFVSFD